MRPLLLAVTLAALGSTAGALTHPPGTNDFRWSGVLSSGQRVEVKGVNGAIRAEATSGREVEVTAVRRAGRRGRVEDVRIETVRHDGGVTVCALYPSRSGRPANRCTPGDDWTTNVEDNDVVVEFVVRVPQGVHFLGRTVNGAVEAEGLPADADASTVNGNVTVRAAGVVEASTVNGDVTASTRRADPGRDLAFTTTNGDVTLEVPADFRARVRASLLNGRFDSDFPLDVTRGRHVGSRAEGEIGRGGRALRMETVNGTIRLRRGRR